MPRNVSCCIDLCAKRYVFRSEIRVIVAIYLCLDQGKPLFVFIPQFQDVQPHLQRRRRLEFRHIGLPAEHRIGHDVRVRIDGTPVRSVLRHLDGQAGAPVAPVAAGIELERIDLLDGIPCVGEGLLDLLAAARGQIVRGPALDIMSIDNLNRRPAVVGVVDRPVVILNRCGNCRRCCRQRQIRTVGRHADSARVWCERKRGKRHCCSEKQ